MSEKNMDMGEMLKKAFERIRELEERQTHSEERMKSVFAHIGELYKSQSIEQTVEILGNLGRSTLEAENSTFYCYDMTENSVFTVADGERVYSDAPDIMQKAFERGKPIVENGRAAVPIKATNNSVMGVIIAENGKFDRELLDKFDIDGEIGSVFKLGLEKERNHQAKITDSLTQIKNRHGMEEYIEGKLLSSFNTDKPVTVIMCDIDHFKRVNDTYGHSAGDIALKSIADTLKNGVRSDDGVFRYGGEEFTLILNGNQEQAYPVVDRIRKTIESTPIDIGLAEPLNVTVSMGLYQVYADKVNKDNIMDVFDNAKNQADKLLYDAKASGRNKVVAESQINIDTYSYRVPLTDISLIQDKGTHVINPALHNNVTTKEAEQYVADSEKALAAEKGINSVSKGDGYG